MKKRKSGNYTNCKHLFAQLFDNAQNDKDKRQVEKEDFSTKNGREDENGRENENGF